MTITVIVPTRNRAVGLAAALESYSRLEAPPGGWDLLVVDNGSTDSTPEVIRRFSAKLPLNGLAESRPGYALAMNAGIESARGDLLLFTDDDIQHPANWLMLYAQAAEAHPDFDVFCGPVSPKWPSAPPP
ncbi:MAG TPA: glycosyltransferase family A protein [Bryobacteraceae bacterium]|nr:glycosyltransferase family A protein [Bryobacteraceae bacterium]